MSAISDRAYVICEQGRYLEETTLHQPFRWTQTLQRAQRYATAGDALRALRAAGIADKMFVTIKAVVRQGMTLSGWVDVDPARYRLLYQDEGKATLLRIPGGTKMQAASEADEQWVEAAEEGT